jgi:hypothetical protein
MLDELESDNKELIFEFITGNENEIMNNPNDTPTTAFLTTRAENSPASLGGGMNRRKV